MSRISKRRAQARLFNSINSGDYPNFQTPRVFENPWGLKARCVFEMWIIISENSFDMRSEQVIMTPLAPLQLKKSNDEVEI
ncbi:MAG: hypothetical protein B6D41_16790 [Chloroflexi bacterium UTCFX4]|nr:MAG: hypothetical protein B6D41_16790 [Chloroflexi bacterium UTCFX4]